MAELIKGSISYTYGETDITSLAPGQFAALQVGLNSLGRDLQLRITESYPHDLKLYNPQTEGWITDNPWIFEIALASESTAGIPFYLLLPDKAGTYAIRTEVEYMDSGVYRLFRSLTDDITVAKDIASINSEVISALSHTAASGKEKAKIDEVIKYLTDVKDRSAAGSSDIEKNIADLLNAVDSLTGMADQDISNIRLLIDRMLTFWQGKWYMSVTDKINSP